MRLSTEVGMTCSNRNSYSYSLLKASHDFAAVYTYSHRRRLSQRGKCLTRTKSRDLFTFITVTLAIICYELLRCCILVFFLSYFAFGSYLLFFPRIYQLGLDVPETQKPRITLRLLRTMLKGVYLHSQSFPDAEYRCNLG